MIHNHHRRLRSQGGGDEPTNVIGIPDVVHQWIHDNPAKAEDYGLIVPSYKDPAEVMVTIPEEALKKPRAKKAPDEKRTRVTLTIKIPADERENGAEILAGYVAEARDLYVEERGWDDNVPAYYPLEAALYDWHRVFVLGETP